jgi:membrane protein
VVVGALVTALLITIGKMAIGIYIGTSGIASSYGAAGSVLAALLWIYYSAQIFLFGAEFTRAYADVCSARQADRGQSVQAKPGDSKQAGAKSVEAAQSG